MEIYGSGAFEFIGDYFAFQRLFDVDECEDFGLPCMFLRVRCDFNLMRCLPHTKRKT